MNRVMAAMAAGMALAAGAAQAAVTDKSPQGFEVVEKATIAAPSGKVWTALQYTGRWWNKEHSWSGDASKLEIDLPRGCFCEKLPKGYVRHMDVVFEDGEKVLRLYGALGPLLMTGAAGHLSFVLTPNGQATDLVVTYDVGGYVKGGIEPLAAPVDAVLGEQVERLKKYLETGKPE